jgi:hypothetical protein
MPPTDTATAAGAAEDFLEFEPGSAWGRVIQAAKDPQCSIWSLMVH